MLNDDGPSYSQIFVHKHTYKYWTIRHSQRKRHSQHFICYVHFMDSSELINNIFKCEQWHKTELNMSKRRAKNSVSNSMTYSTALSLTFGDPQFFFLLIKICFCAKARIKREAFLPISLPVFLHRMWSSAKTEEKKSKNRCPADKKDNIFACNILIKIVSASEDKKANRTI